MDGLLLRTRWHLHVGCRSQEPNNRQRKRFHSYSGTSGTIPQIRHAILRHASNCIWDDDGDHYRHHPGTNTNWPCSPEVGKPVGCVHRHSVSVCGPGSLDFAVPLTTLQGLRFRRALAESDHMTDNRALALWLLILESEVAGYLTLMLPSWTLVYLNVPPTKFSYYAADAIALVLSAMSQAPLMIAVGLVLAHWTASKTMNESGSDMAQIG